MGRYDAARASWRMAKAALELFRPDGRLNDRAWAEARVGEALPALAGKAWTTLRHLLQAHEAFTFLDHLHARLGEAADRSRVARGAGAARWLRTAPRATTTRAMPRRSSCKRSSAGSSPPTGDRGTAQVTGDAPHDGSGQQRGGERQQRPADAPVPPSHPEPRAPGPETALLEYTSLPKGRRRGQCPYQLLGLDLPSYDFWSLLEREAAQITAAEQCPSSARGLAFLNAKCQPENHCIWDDALRSSHFQVVRLASGRCVGFSAGPSLSSTLYLCRKRSGGWLGPGLRWSWCNLRVRTDLPLE